MRYILTYNDKETFLEENPKKGIKTPVMWKYPVNLGEFYRDGDVQYDTTTGEVTAYTAPTKAEEPPMKGLVKCFREEGKNDILLLYDMFGAAPDGLEFYSIAKYPYDLFDLKSQTELTPGSACILPEVNDIYNGNYCAIEANPLTPGDEYQYENQYGTFPDNPWAEKYSGITYISQDKGILSAATMDEYGYVGGEEGFYPTSKIVYGDLSEEVYGANGDQYTVFKMPTGTPVSSYTKVARILDLVNDTETRIPAVSYEPNANGFLVKNFMMGSDLSSCGYTATKDQWFGMVLEGSSGPSPVANAQRPNSNLIMGANIPPKAVFKEFYTEGETGNTAHGFRDGTTTGANVLYYTIFYLSGNPIDQGGDVESRSVNPKVLGGPEVEGEVSSEENKLPVYALTRQHTYRVTKDNVESEEGPSEETTLKSNEVIYDEAFDGVYDLYSTIANVSGGTALSGYIGTISIINSSVQKGELVTKVEPGFAHVRQPESVHYNGERNDSGSGDYVIPGADVDAPGSKIDLLTIPMPGLDR